jgi:hypothetical protein
MKILTKKETATYVTGVVLTGDEFLKLVKANLTGWIDLKLSNTEVEEYTIDLDYDEVTINGDVTVTFDDCNELPVVSPKPPVAKKKSTAKRKTK